MTVLNEVELESNESNQTEGAISVEMKLSNREENNDLDHGGEQHRRAWKRLNKLAAQQPTRRTDTSFKAPMGFEIANVISEERHHGPFLCAICTNLCGLDALVTTTCSHVFCKTCLETWLHRSDKCPSCNTSLTFHGGPDRATTMISGHALHALPLSKAQAVAYRVLARVKVKCPLNKVACRWKGDYGDLQAHLVSPTAHVTTRQQQQVETVNDDDGDDDEVMYDELDSKALAESFKEEANGKFASGNYQQAGQLYSKGIAVLAADSSNQNQQLLAALYSNRGAASTKLKDWNQCIDDCDKAVRLDETYIKAYVRRSKAKMELGQFEDAVRGLEIACENNPKSTALTKDLIYATEVRDNFQLGMQQMEESQYASAKATYGSLLRESSSSRVILAAARADLGIGLTDSAQRLSLQVVRLNPQNSDAYVVRGQCMYLAGEFDNGVSLLREALRLDPDNEQAKQALRQCKKVKDAVAVARKAIFTRKFDQAVEAFGLALGECDPLPHKAPLYSTLHAERAEAYLRLRKYQAALKDSSLAIYVRDDFVKAWLIKVKAFHGLGRHEEARDELEDLIRKWGSNEPTIRKAWDNADFLVRKEKRPDFYRLLGVSQIASLMEIKKRYKVKAMEYHPDKWVSASQQDQKKAEENFKLLGEALETLSDDFRRQLWDEGYDEDAIRERVAAAHEAAHRSEHYHRRGGR